MYVPIYVLALAKGGNKAQSVKTQTLQLNCLGLGLLLPSCVTLSTFLIFLGPSFLMCQLEDKQKNTLQRVLCKTNWHKIGKTLRTMPGTGKVLGRS